VAALAALANGMLPLKKIAEEQAAKEAQNELAAAMAGSFGGGHMQPTAPRKETIVVEHRELATAGV